MTLDDMVLAKRFFGKTKFQGGWEPLAEPIICPPMAGASGGRLAVAVSRMGGMGFIGAGYMSVTQLLDELVECSVRPVGKIMSDNQEKEGRRPIGVGFLAWKLTALNGGKLPKLTDAPDTSPAHQLIWITVRKQLGAAWFSFGTHDDLKAWIALLRHWDNSLCEGNKYETMRIVIGVGSLQQVQDSLGLRPAALSLTGNEAGGHGLAASPPLKQLLAQVQGWFTNEEPQQRPLLFAAGGLSNGYEAKTLLALGVDAVVFGTRFLLTLESLYSDKQKDLLVRAGSTNPGAQGNSSSGTTVRSKAFDEARGIFGWPEGVDGRGLYSQTVADYDAHKDTRSAYKDARNDGYLSRVVTWAGEGIVCMDDIQSASKLTQRLADEIGRDPRR